MTVVYLVQYLNSPMKLFGLIGLGCGVFGAASGTVTIGMRLFRGVDMTGNPLLLLTALSLLMSLQFFVCGLLGELCVRIYYQGQNREPYAIRELVNFEARSTAAQNHGPTSRAA